MELQEWVVANPPGSDMLWKDALYHQVNFVGGTLGRLFGDVKADGRFHRANAEVVSVHWSKSIACPIYKFELPWAEIVLRNNFYNWNVAVLAAEEIEFDWKQVIDEFHGEYLFLEGMEEYGRPAYPTAKREFCFMCNDSYGVYGALLLIKLAARGKK